MSEAEMQHPAPPEQRVDVVVVGAGLGRGPPRRAMSLAAGLSVLVLEARDRVGGRLLNRHARGRGRGRTRRREWVRTRPRTACWISPTSSCRPLPTYVEGEHYLAVERGGNATGETTSSCPKTLSRTSAKRSNASRRW